MKLKKIPALAVFPLLMTMLCSCSTDINSFSVDTRELYYKYRYASEGTSTEITIDNKHMEFAEKCFDEINIAGAVLALPMNLSDLPLGLEFISDDEPVQIYKGINISEGKLMFGEKTAANASVMYSVNESISSGQIVSMEFHQSLIDTAMSVNIGGENAHMTAERAKELFGDSGYSDRVFYDLGDGRNIILGYIDLGDSDDSNAFSVILNTMRII